MTPLHAISKAKSFRGDLDTLLQRMKEHRSEMLLVNPTDGTWAVEQGEAIAQHTISIRAVEDAIMRQGMVLKNIGQQPTPYPDTKLTAESFAETLYTRYCESVGGKAFNGDPLPDWNTFKADPAKQPQALAWVDAARTGIEKLFKVHPTSGVKL
jgi:hypothetical protein